MARRSPLLILALAAVALGAAPELSLAQARGGAAATSHDPHVKFRDGARYLRDLADGLEIPRDEICKELGRYDCDKAFLVVLGGVDPYEVRVLAPLEHASLAAPIAFDRVALQACVSRVTRDVATPATAVLYKAPTIAPRGRAAPDKVWMETTIGSIYDRVLRREATAAEKARMIRFYQTVARDRHEAVADIPKDWVTLSCFTVASSLESAFY